ncbi:hypothetical protein OOZ51_02555 [Arthrobacter sp. MI7-26]|uniref:hypothetical protein n=1 Tax=Arthrobacter sp. MI7-26 TaxID=2993653 RepID=UPI0022494CF4|nr:hypothetical protein [Arthrobacter sp. MI7-26]MCX2746693.1 hypothetical protein [Arthrobacter sp. MI7-26]
MEDQLHTGTRRQQVGDRSSIGAVDIWLVQVRRNVAYVRTEHRAVAALAAYVDASRILPRLRQLRQQHAVDDADRYSALELST